MWKYDTQLGSLEKLEKLLDACKRLGVKTDPMVIGSLGIIPLFSWYHEVTEWSKRLLLHILFDNFQPFCLHLTKELCFLLELWQRGRHNQFPHPPFGDGDSPSFMLVRIIKGFTYDIKLQSLLIDYTINFRQCNLSVMFYLFSYDLHLQPHFYHLTWMLLSNTSSIAVQLQTCCQQTSQGLKNLLNFHYDLRSDSQQLVNNYVELCIDAVADNIGDTCSCLSLSRVICLNLQCRNKRCIVFLVPFVYYTVLVSLSQSEFRQMEDIPEFVGVGVYLNFLIVLSCARPSWVIE